MENRLRGKRSWLWVVPTGLAVVLTLLIVVPLAAMFMNMDKAGFEAVFAKDSLLRVFGNSVLASALTTVISVVLAYIPAWCMERTAMKGKRVLRMLITVPMLLPSVSIGMGAVMLLGNNGLLTNILGLAYSNIYGLGGIVLGSVLYSLPVAFLMIDNILKYEDSAPYEAAKVLGISPPRQFCAITLPYLRKPMISVIFSVFTLSFTDYGVPLMVGGKFKTLPVVMYEEVIGRLNFSKGCIYGAILLLPALIAFLIDLANKQQAGSAALVRPFDLSERSIRDTAATVATALMAFVCVLPIVSFVVLAFVRKYPFDMALSFDNFLDTFRMDGGKYLLNSVIMALFVAAVGTALCVLCAYFTARMKVRFSRYLHLVAMSTGAIPGVVLGLSYVLAFKGSPVYGTLIILVMVNIVHFFSSPYLMMYNTFSKLNGNLESVAVTLGINKRRLLFDVLLPRCKKTIGEMISFFFVNCMMTISAVSFLANTDNKPIALMINQFEAQAQLEAAAVVSLLILLVNIAVKTLLERQNTER